MTEAPQTVLDIGERAAASIIDVGVVGALLILSLAANVALVVALTRCWKAHARSQGDTK